MSFTNAQLATKIADLITYWSSFNSEYSDWIGGSVGGGPNTDGDYPLTNWAGEETLLPCPAQLADDVTGYVAIVDASAVAAAASAAAAATSESNASTSASTATAQAVLADADRVSAEAAETAATDAKVTAITQANLATDRAGYSQDWAQTAYQTLVPAAAGGDEVDDYSALHWATVAENFAGSVDSGLYGQLAQDEIVTGSWQLNTAAVNEVGLKFHNTNTVLVPGARGHTWRLVTGQPGNYDGYFMIQDEGTPSTPPVMYIAPGVNGGVNFGSKVLILDGKSIGSNTSSSLAFYMPYDGTRARMSFRGPNPGNAEYRIESYVYGDTGLQAANHALFKTDQQYNVSAQFYGSVIVDLTLAVTGDVTGANLNVANWDTAYGWGDHASGGYASITGINTFVDEIRTTEVVQPSGLGAGTAALSAAFLYLDGKEAIDGDDTWLRLNQAGAFSNGTYLSGLLRVDGNIMVGSARTITTVAFDNWNTAYGWGDHSLGGYLTSYSEVDTLATVAARGSTYGGDIEMTAVGANTDPGLNSLRVGGYGIMGSRASMYITNAAASSSIIFGIGGVHNFNNEMTLNGSGLDILGTLTVGGTINVPGAGTGILPVTTTAGSLRISNGTQYVDFGPRNSSYTHMDTNASAGFYSYKDFTVVGTADVRKASHGNYLYHQSASYDNDQNGGITFSTSAPSGGTTGDIWFEYT